MAKLTASDKAWIESHGGTVGVVSESEAREREAAYKTRTQQEAERQKAYEAAKAADIELIGDRPTPTKAEVEATRAKASGVTLIGDTQTREQKETEARRVKAAGIVLPGDVPTPTKKVTQPYTRIGRLGDAVRPEGTTVTKTVTLQTGERVLASEYAKLTDEEKHNLSVLGIAAWNEHMAVKAKGLQKALKPFESEGGYDLVAALSAGKPRSYLLRAGFKAKDIEQAAKALGQPDIAEQKRALQILSPYKTWTSPDGVHKQEAYDLLAAVRAGVSAETLKAAGFDTAAYTATRQWLGVEKKLRPYTDKQGNYDIVAALRKGVVTVNDLATYGYNEDTVKWAAHQSKLGALQEHWENITPWEEWKGEKATPKGVAKIGSDIAIAATPGVGTAVYWDRMSPTWRVISIVTDIACLIPVVTAIGAGVRTARGLGVAARAAAIGRATGRVALAELKAPFTMLRHPIKTAKVALSPWETILRPSKVPLSGMEIRTTTVRLPVSDVGSAKVAMKARDQLVASIARGARPVAEVEGQRIELARVALNRIGVPAIVHSTPDIRPFLEGGIIAAGREGSGLFVSPSLHTNFTLATAFGNVPSGGVRGGLIITDSTILSKLASSEKLYRGTAEIEAILRQGVKLPTPSQVLITRDISGETLTLLVMGKPFTPAQVAKLKVIGSVDAVRQMFVSPAKIGRVSKQYDKLLAVRQQITALQKDAATLAKEGKAAAASRALARANDLIADANRIGNSIGDTYRSARVARATAGQYVFLNTGRAGVLERYERITRGASVATMRNGRVLRIPELRITPRVPQRPEVTQRVSRGAAPRGVVQPRLRRGAETRRAGTTEYPYLPQVPRGYKTTLYKPTGVTGYVPVTPTGITAIRGGRVPVKPVKVVPIRIPARDFKPASLDEEQRRSILAYKQGWCYKLFYPSPKGEVLVNSRKPLVGVEYHKGPGSAARSVIARGGKLPAHMQYDMGVMDVHFDIPQSWQRWERKPRMTFLRDPLQQTGIRPTVRRTSRRRARTVKRRARVQAGVSRIVI